MTHRDAPRAGRTTWRRLEIALASALLIGSSAVAPTAASQDPPATRSADDRVTEWPQRSRAGTGASAAASRKLDQIPGLATELQRASEGRAGAASSGGGTSHVMVQADSAEAALRAVEAVGGTDVIVGGPLVEAVVPTDRLPELAGAAGVRLVSQPRRGQVSVESEGVGSTGSSMLHANGTDGAGMTVAVIDGGFAGYESRLGTELPASPSIDFDRCPAPENSEHGTAVAEIVHDMAPGAALRLVCIRTAAEIIDALDTLPVDVDIVNISLGWTLLDRGDGSGPIAGAVERARARGVLVVVAAGNYGYTHRHQSATGDTPGETLSDLVNMPGGDDGLAFEVAPSSTAYISLQWDAWPTTALDFDLFVENDRGTIVAESLIVQDGSAPPIEYVEVTNTSASYRIYHVLVNRYAGRGTPRMDVFFDGGVTGTESPTDSSIGDPAVSRAALAVGASCHALGTPPTSVEPFSSRGPTIDGRVSPDLVGPDGVSSSVYGDSTSCSTDGGFFGTSASAPHAAGLAALTWQTNPQLDVAELHRYLESAAYDSGPEGNDNTFGAGGLAVGWGSLEGPAVVPAPQAFTRMTPTRLMDSRPGAPAYPGELESGDRTTPIPAGGVVKVLARGAGTGVPESAVAVVLNVTAVAPTAGGYLTVYPDGTRPNASSVNFAPTRTTPVHVTATVGFDDSVRIFNAAGSTHVLVDIAGWYGPTTDQGEPSTDRLTPLAAPARAMDTRPGEESLGYAESGVGRTTPIPAADQLDVRVAGLGGVPADATAVVMNVTAITPTASTFVTAFPTGTPLPIASNLNPRRGDVVANLVVVPVGEGGEVSFYNAAGSTHLAVDVVAYFRPDVGAGYVPLDPARILDTRTGTGLRRAAIGATSTYQLKVARLESVPGDAAAVMLGVAAVSPSVGGYLTVFPGSSAVPLASNLNFTRGSIVANAAIAGLGPAGTVSFYNAAGSTHVIGDLSGYFVDPANVQLPPP